MTRPPVFADREGALLVASLILRSTAKAQTADGVRKALTDTHPKEAAGLADLGFLDTICESIAGYTYGTLEIMADALEACSKIDDAKWLEIIHKVYADLKADQAA